jgi:hypothetical protein
MKMARMKQTRNRELPLLLLPPPPPLLLLLLLLRVPVRKRSLYSYVLQPQQLDGLSFPLTCARMMRVAMQVRVTRPRRASLSRAIPSPRVMRYAALQGKAIAPQQRSHLMV